MAISEFAAWLREQTSKLDRPFQEHTITNYTDAARSLDRWMTAQGIDEDFAACDTTMLNRFFASYLKAHSQGGTNTLQRNLAHIFVWLDETYDHPNPYTARLNRYAPVKKRPATLAEEFIKDMLDVTGGGKARSFEDVRDHAIIRVFTEGVRRLHAEAELHALWLGARGRGAMTGSGVYQMLKRRAAEAGYDPAVRPHQFRHTFAHDWLEGGGSEGDLMRLMGWTDRSMLDLYAEDLQVERAIQAKRKRGNIY
jgi:site-specific recombinase XerD